MRNAARRLVRPRKTAAVFARHGTAAATGRLSAVRDDYIGHDAKQRQELSARLPVHAGTRRHGDRSRRQRSDRASEGLPQDETRVDQALRAQVMSTALTSHAMRSLCAIFRTLTAAAALAAAGCASHYERICPVRDAFFSGRLDEANTLLDRHDLRLRDGDVKQLDRAIIELANGNPHSAEEILRTVRDRFDKFEDRSLAEEGASLLTDDNIKAYPGEDY